MAIPVTTAPASASGGVGVSGFGTGMAAISIIGTLFSAFGRHQAGATQRKLLEYNSRVAEYQAQDVIARGEVLATRRREETRSVIGSQRATLAGQGVEINADSALDVQANAAYLGELDAMTIKNNAAREAWGYRVQARDFSLRGQYTQLEADMLAGETLLTGASNLLLAHYGFRPYRASSSPTEMGLRFLLMGY